MVIQLIFLGAPGSGKTTQATILAAQWQIPRISVNEIARQAIANTTGYGLHVRDYLDGDRPLHDLLMIALIRDRLDQPDAQRGWILDDFPQNLVQAQALEGLLRGSGRADPLAIHLETSLVVLLERLLQSGAAKPDGMSSQHQLVMAQKQLLPLVQFYQQRRSLYPVNGNLPIEAVTHILQLLLQDRSN